MTTETLCTLLPDDELNALKKKIPEGSTPLWHYWKRFIEDWLATGYSTATVESVRASLKAILRHTPLRTIEQFNAPRKVKQILLEFKEKRGFSPATYNCYLKNLNTYFIWMEGEEYIEENKLRKIKRCKQTTNEQFTLPEENINKIRMQVMTRRQTTLERSRNILFIELLAFTGARPIEFQKMKKDDIYATNNGYKIRINGAKQKGKPRYYRLPSHIRDHYLTYRRYRDMLRPNEDHFFISKSKSTGWTTKGMENLMKRLSKELDFKITMYGFRRYVATKLHKNKVDIHAIKDYLGHTRVTTTMRYIESSCARTQDASLIMATSMTEAIKKQ